MLSLSSVPGLRLKVGVKVVGVDEKEPYLVVDVEDEGLGLVYVINPEGEFFEGLPRSLFALDLAKPALRTESDNAFLLAEAIANEFGLDTSCGFEWRMSFDGNRFPRLLISNNLRTVFFDTSPSLMEPYFHVPGLKGVDLSAADVDRRALIAVATHVFGAEALS